MSFEVNLINLRKSMGMSQEMLAEKIEVSRQTIYKWETGQSYPEMDRLIQLSELFKCSIDDLIKKEINTTPEKEKEKYNSFYNKFSFFIALGVFLIIFGVAITTLLFQIFGEDNYVIPTVVLLTFVATSVGIFIYFGMMGEEFKKKIPANASYYTEEEVQAFIKKFTLGLTLSIAMIILSVVVFIVISEYVAINEESLWPASIMLAMIAFSVGTIVYLGNQYSKVKMEVVPKKENKMVNTITSIIMLTATAIFLYLGFVKNQWHPGWAVYPIGGVLCGIVSVIFEHKDSSNNSSNS